MMGGDTKQVHERRHAEAGFRARRAQSDEAMAMRASA